MQKDEKNELDKFYHDSIQFTKSHYENFPVISLFLKKELKKYISVIYRFARQADDIADEGSMSSEKRVSLLNEYEELLNDALQGKFKYGFWKVLEDTIKCKNLSVEHFYNLLKAFKQDTHKNSYSNFDDLLCYCRNSANPVGRLILELHDIRDPLPNQLSDKICTALQLTNFYQDVKIDLKKDRLYLPLSELEIFNISQNNDRSIVYDENFIKFMKFQVERVKKLFTEGKKLLSYLPSGLKLQIRMTIKGGELVLRKIEELNYNVLEFRPTLSKIDFMKLFLISVIRGK